MMTSTQLLSDLKSMQIAYVHGFQKNVHDKSLESILVKRLRHAGFIVGEPIEVMWRGWGRHANMVVRLGRHTHFALRHHEASHVLVSPYRLGHQGLP